MRLRRFDEPIGGFKRASKEIRMTQPSHSWRQLAAVFALALLAACSSHRQTQTSQASAASAPRYVFMRTNTSAGTIISNTDGMALYTYDKDPAGQSTCYGECAKYMHPYLVNGTYKPWGKMSIITRSDGTQQWAYDGHPLYTFVQDTAPGEIKGNGFHNDFHVVTVPA
jgi:predicted lipoprotein with Yx(FWY)xxD motif